MPAQAVQNGVPGDYVYVVNEDDTVSVQPVTAGPSDGTDTVITKGLTPGQTVVIDGVDRLTQGAKVTVAAEPGSAATPGASPGPGAPGAAPADPPAWHGHHHRRAENGSSGAAAPSPAAQ